VIYIKVILAILIVFIVLFMAYSSMRLDHLTLYD